MSELKEKKQQDTKRTSSQDSFRTHKTLRLPILRKQESFEIPRIVTRELPRYTEQTPYALDSFQKTLKEVENLTSYEEQHRFQQQVKNGEIFRIPRHFCDDKELVLEAVRHNGMLLEFASERLKSDVEVVLSAVRDIHLSIVYASEDLKAMRLVADVLVDSIGVDASISACRSLQHICESLRGNETFMLEAIVKSAAFFCFAERTLRDNLEFRKKAIEENQLVIDYFF